MKARFNCHQMFQPRRNRKEVVEMTDLVDIVSAINDLLKKEDSKSVSSFLHKLTGSSRKPIDNPRDFLQKRLGKGNSVSQKVELSDSSSISSDDSEFSKELLQVNAKSSEKSEPTKVKQNQTTSNSVVSNAPRSQRLNKSKITPGPINLKDKKNMKLSSSKPSISLKDDSDSFDDSDSSDSVTNDLKENVCQGSSLNDSKSSNKKVDSSSVPSKVPLPPILKGTKEQSSGITAKSSVNGTGISKITKNSVIKTPSLSTFGKKDQKKDAFTTKTEKRAPILNKSPASKDDSSDSSTDSSDSSSSIKESYVKSKVDVSKPLELRKKGIDLSLSKKSEKGRGKNDNHQKDEVSKDIKSISTTKQTISAKKSSVEPLIDLKNVSSSDSSTSDDSGDEPKTKSLSQKKAVTGVMKAKTTLNIKAGKPLPLRSNVSSSSDSSDSELDLCKSKTEEFLSNRASLNASSKKIGAKSRKSQKNSLILSEQPKKSNQVSLDDSKKESKEIKQESMTKKSVKDGVGALSIPKIEDKSVLKLKEDDGSDSSTDLSSSESVVPSSLSNSAIPAITLLNKNSAANIKNVKNSKSNDDVVSAKMGSILNQTSSSLSSSDEVELSKSKSGFNVYSKKGQSKAIGVDKKSIAQKALMFGDKTMSNQTPKLINIGSTSSAVIKSSISSSDSDTSSDEEQSILSSTKKSNTPSNVKVNQQKAEAKSEKNLIKASSKFISSKNDDNSIKGESTPAKNVEALGSQEKSKSSKTSTIFKSAGKAKLTYGKDKDLVSKPKVVAPISKSKPLSQKVDRVDSSTDSSGDSQDTDNYQKDISNGKKINEQSKSSFQSITESTRKSDSSDDSSSLSSDDDQSKTKVKQNAKLSKGDSSKVEKLPKQDSIDIKNLSDTRKNNKSTTQKRQILKTSSKENSKNSNSFDLSDKKKPKPASKVAVNKSSTVQTDQNITFNTSGLFKTPVSKLTKTKKLPESATQIKSSSSSSDTDSDLEQTKTESKKDTIFDANNSLKLSTPTKLPQLNDNSEISIEDISNLTDKNRKRKMGVSSNDSDKRKDTPYVNKSSSFRRINPDVNSLPEELRDNQFKPTGRNDVGLKAQKAFNNVQGKDYKREKTKKKRGGFVGGSIDPTPRSFKFNEDDE